jgi:N-acetylmuramoyl-L-alanine amidase
MSKIYWDKGHGGRDPGAIGNGLQEKELVSKIVNYGMSYLSNLYEGFEQKSSRVSDETRTLDQRTDEANSWGAKVLISVHINSATAKTANGFESHVYTNVDAKTIAFQNMLHNEIMQVNRAFGVTTDRGMKRSNFHMLRESKMVACLTENLFIVNVSDSNKLKNNEYLKAIGEAHARGIAKYLGLKQKTVKTQEIKIDSNTFYRVVAGSFNSKQLAELQMDALKKAGFNSFIDTYKK